LRYGRVRVPLRRSRREKCHHHRDSTEKAQGADDYQVKTPLATDDVANSRSIAIAVFTILLPTVLPSLPHFEPAVRDRI